MGADNTAIIFEKIYICIYIHIQVSHLESNSTSPSAECLGYYVVSTRRLGIQIELCFVI